MVQHTMHLKTIIIGFMTNSSLKALNYGLYIVVSAELVKALEFRLYWSSGAIKPIIVDYERYAI
jgi:hypothetical protein